MQGRYSSKMLKLLLNQHFSITLLHTLDVTVMGLYIKIFYFYNTACKILAISSSATIKQNMNVNTFELIYSLFFSHFFFWPSSGLSMHGTLLPVLHLTERYTPFQLLCCLKSRVTIKQANKFLLNYYVKSPLNLPVP